ncbi:glutamate--tRNA(Gln) ligase [Sulfurimonas denitrificans DSM 1251]|uniref:Glutamate--tRNA ligase 2 n=1 Tax=Sulfurimonas denitrificans (strain ATCC 33889 / DSM 1251) TaxID=326298 RepID=SYE2_SULDN|nr:glutamate--tRNA ligase [Sulfurimonas denitrificans]Q30RP4.1 RecName: Full=Glutamate--tRNA ligase 2; AltName: Full=Glutamyl-tRNA synthetase 2; Short=GluRS 2 [Sulfurimonas denitrificans DSM 1251]ABB44337.1 glutamate--tRNA(Gln) ligase [Sulfurimonas denitrificans DSM 1251]MDD3441968.1 glutamate--tRNA ligase [Sulfurimonas denitrificans]
MLRFAPSPTGDMHIGNLRVAIFNYIVSKQRKEDLVIRIEDTDKDRNIEGKDKEILDILNLFGIDYSVVMYQSENFRFHRAMALQLLQDKRAFNCFCSSDWLDKKREEAKNSKTAYRYDDACASLPDELVIDNEHPFTVRIRKPLEPIIIKDHIKGEIKFEPNDIDSFIIMRQDKTPMYNFACAVDDMLSDISLVIRGEDHVSNTPKQILIREALGYSKNIEYAHLPIILNDDGKKMSKRDDASSVKWLLEEGYLPSAIANYLILIGNKPPKEIFTIQEAIEWFSLENISKSPARFDINMLKHVNKEHLKILDAKELSRYVGFADAQIGEVAKIYLEEASTTKELRAKIALIFAEKNIPDEFKEYAQTIVKIIQKAPYFEEYEDFKNYIIQESGLKGKNFFKPLRILLMGSEHGPDIATVYKHIKNYLGEIVK